MNDDLKQNASELWQLRQPYSWKIAFVFFAIALVMAYSARRTQIDKGMRMTAEGLAYAVGLRDSADAAVGWTNFFRSAFPLAVSEKTAVSRIEDFDRNQLPAFSYIVTEPTEEFDVDSGEFIETGKQDYLVRPFGYVTFVLRKMVETIEIAIWGTLLAILLSLPLTYFGARGYTVNSFTYNLARGLCSFCRALPELIIAIFFVIVYGFGPIPGVIALGLHCCGFLGKFFADDIENADTGPQDALRSTGASRIKVLWYAVLPQVMPQFLAYVQYILERNVRSATVLGIVGAGGIGLELKGRLDLSDYSHVTTILLIVFLTVFLLEHITQFVRSRLIGR